MNVATLDTGCADFNSMKSAIGRYGYESVVNRDPKVTSRAGKLLLPGASAAQATMGRLRDRDLTDLIRACT